MCGIRKKSYLEEKTDDYANVVLHRTGVSTKVLKTEYDLSTMSYDIKYYGRLLKSCLERTVVAADMPDAKAVITYPI